jgi:hypothetical protein
VEDPDNAPEFLLLEFKTKQVVLNFLPNKNGVATPVFYYFTFILLQVIGTELRMKHGR